MRTYLPYADFAECARCFTLKRLTKQRHDVMEILYLLSGRNHPSRGDRFMYNSPPKKVWQHCPFTLIQYGLALCDEYERRRDGKPDPIRERLLERQHWFRGQRSQENEARPHFLDSEQMHNSHRAILARQDEAHYEQFGFEREPEDEKVFYWPVEEAARQYDPDELRRDRERERERRRREEEQERRDREGDEFEDDDSGDSDDDDCAPDDPFDDWSTPSNTEERLGRGGPASPTGRIPVTDDGDCDCHACRVARQAQARETNQRVNPGGWGFTTDFRQFEEAIAPSDIREVAAALQAMSRNDQMRTLYGGSPWEALTGEQR